ncbi:proline-rich receptor-like protein kinase PERK9 [Ischnura elegans]|uniref:proline-rich receptor-like protein kinase PERK9 n=1 Tax=Ischnura elegans TaxID=197161 RepID=UPI001ED8B1A6|nr:proline-rich receptor-like protein kinase PERK9 [Ischnura elegans]
MDRLPRPNSRIRRLSSLCSLRSYALRSHGPPPFLSTLKSPSVPPDGKGVSKEAKPSASQLPDSPDSPGSSVPSARVSRGAPLDDAASPSAQDNTPPRAAMSSLSSFKDNSMRSLTSPRSAFVPIDPAATSTPSSVLTMTCIPPPRPPPGGAAPMAFSPDSRKRQASESPTNDRARTCFVVCGVHFSTRVEVIGRKLERMGCGDRHVQAGNNKRRSTVLRQGGQGDVTIKRRGSAGSHHPHGS